MQPASYFDGEIAEWPEVCGSRRHRPRRTGFKKPALVLRRKMKDHDKDISKNPRELRL